MITIQGILGDANIKATPLFPDEGSRKAFLKRYDEAVPPKLKELERARALSYHNFVFRILC